MRRVKDSDKMHGWHVYECPKCKDRIHSPYAPDRVVCFCPKKAKEKIPPWHAFGDWIEIFLVVFGITKCRWGWFKRSVLRLKPSAVDACGIRQAKANQIGWLFAVWLRSNLDPTPGSR